MLTWKFKFRTYPDDSPVRTGLLVTAKNISEVEQNFGSYLAQLKAAHGDAKGPPVLHIAQTEQPDDGDWSLKMDQVCAKHKEELKALLGLTSRRIHWLQIFAGNRFHQDHHLVSGLLK